MLNQLWRALRKVAFTHKLKSMAENIASVEPQAPLKRIAETPAEEVSAKVSKSKKKKGKKQHVVTLGQSEGFKRKIALLTSYNGSGYYGVQINEGYPTIERDLFAALVSVGAVPQEHVDHPHKMWFQRGSRTDKGVSAAGQTFSLKAVIIPDLVTKVNEKLPEQIRIMGFVRTTNGFDSKNFCNARTYTYMTPTFAFAPIEKFITDDFRVPSETLNKVRETLHRFVGTHNFHNFTSGVKPDQASAKRYIQKFVCSEPYVRDGIEFVTLTVRGQSFMLHQIRKMIGLTIAIVRGFCQDSVMDKCWQPEKADIPKAPGLGLVLEELHFDGYNKKWGKDGIHDPIDWGPYREGQAQFKEKYILSEIVRVEKTERSMFNWMRTLHNHNFEAGRQEGPDKPWLYAAEQKVAALRQSEAAEDPSVTQTSLQDQSAIVTQDQTAPESKPSLDQLGSHPSRGKTAPLPDTPPVTQFSPIKEEITSPAAPHPPARSRDQTEVSSTTQEQADLSTGTELNHADGQNSLNDISSTAELSKSNGQCSAAAVEIEQESLCSETKVL